MPIINRLLIAFIVWELLVLATLPARSQTDSIPVPMSAQERGVVLSMCDNATWAAKRQFDGVCDYFRSKFETVEAKAKADAAAPVEPKKD